MRNGRRAAIPLMSSLGLSMSKAHLYSNYLLCPYEEGARGPFKFDCWGILRDLLHYVSGVPWHHIPEFGGITRSNGMHESFVSIRDHFDETDAPVEGCAVCAYDSEGYMRHVGFYIDGEVLHTNKNGPKHIPVKKFQRFGRLEFYVHR